MSTNSSGIAKALHFLNKQYVFSPPSSVPAGYFASGISQITVTMCNFLGACGTASIQLAVTGKNAPVVTIGGDQSFSTTVAAGLSINGDGYVSVCNFTAKGGALPATIPYIVERFIPIEPEPEPEPELSSPSLNGITGSEEDQVVSSTVQRKPNNQPSPSSLVHIEGQHVIDIPLESDGSVLMPQDSTMWDDEPREADIETPVESRRAPRQGSRVPSRAAPSPAPSHNVSPALAHASSPVASVPISLRGRPITNRFSLTNAPTDASFNGTTEIPPALSKSLQLNSQRTLLPPLATPISKHPSLTSPPNNDVFPRPLTFTAPKHSLPTGPPPPTENPQLTEWIIQAREWKEVCADDTGASSYYNETTQESIWEAPTSQGYTRADTRLVLRDGTVIDDPATAPALEASLTTSMVPSDPLALTSVKSDITWC